MHQQPVQETAAARVHEIENFQDVLAIIRGDIIQNRIEPDGIASMGNRLAFGVEQRQGGIHRGIEPPCPTVKTHTLTTPQRDSITIDIGRGFGLPIYRRPNDHCLGFLREIIGRFLGDGG